MLPTKEKDFQDSLARIALKPNLSILAEILKANRTYSNQTSHSRQKLDQACFQARNSYKVMNRQRYDQNLH